MRVVSVLPYFLKRSSYKRHEMAIEEQQMNK